MAYVPKRDPCVKCNNPVFFAERLVIEDQLYHRTCFQCARCSSVLTLGNFYQTEKDNEFCCETCPDEERSNSSISKNGETNRLSIAQRIALFERETSSVLKKSLSDEEKSKSLNRQLQSSTSQGLSNFLSTQLKQENEENKNDEDESSSDESEDEKQPELTNGDNFASTSTDIEQPKITEEIIPSPTKEVDEIKSKIPTELINESQNSLDKAIAEITNDDDSHHIQDEFEIEFEKLAEEAVSGSFTPIIIKKQPIEPVESSTVAAEESVTAKEEEIVEIPIEIKVVAINDEPEEVKDNENCYADTNKTSSNPFGDDDDEEEIKVKRPSLNPFGSCSEEDDEVQKVKSEPSKQYNTLPKPPRPPPPRTSEKFKAISTNPFDSDEDNAKDLSHTKTPVPTPRRLV